MSLEDNLGEKFFELLKQWKEYCETSHVQFSSRAEDVTECEAYQELVKMRKEVLPFICRAYFVDSAAFDIKKSKGFSTMVSFGFPRLVQSVLKDEFKIPQNLQGNINGIRNYTSKWLANYLGLEKALFDGI